MQHGAEIGRGFALRQRTRLRLGAAVGLQLQGDRLGVQRVASAQGVGALGDRPLERLPDRRDALLRLHRFGAMRKAVRTAGGSEPVEPLGGVDGGLFFLFRGGLQAGDFFLLGLDDRVEIGGAALQLLDSRLRVGELPARRLGLGEIGGGSPRGFQGDALASLLAFANRLAQGRVRRARRLAQRLELIEIAFESGRRLELRGVFVVARGDFLGGRQHDVGGKLHRLQFADDLLRREFENIVVIVSEGKERGDREDEDENHRGDRGFDDDPLARHAPHGQDRRRGDHRAAKPDPVAGLLLHDVDHAAGGRVKHPAEHRRGDRHADAAKVRLARPELSHRRRESGEQARPEVFRRRRARAGLGGRGRN